MLKILTVLKYGGIYDENHVIKIKNMINKYVTIPHEFICLSDKSSMNFNTIDLRDDLEGWFSKMELFKFSGPCLYLDLDTIVTNNIDDIIKDCMNSKSKLIILNDVYLKQDFMQSSLMFWGGNLECIYNIFYNNKQKYINRDFTLIGKSKTQKLSDQNIIYKICKEEKISYSFFKQQGNSIVSFKANINYGKFFNKEKHKIVFFHGKPRPWEQKQIAY